MASCGVLRFGQLAGQAFVLGVSQARFDLLRKGNVLDSLLQQDENTHPRILIFDEKFEFAPLYHLTQTTLDAASSQLERLITQRDLKDRRVFESSGGQQRSCGARSHCCGNGPASSWTR